ncbi:glycosyl hydrolase family 95 catalytic domain-containing protein [Armatimonas sp.]|uniref:glycosyl hydrolase family 95 catalytic domain-containing protein n=1 Tax=Armatimonas sp. TaxID=1872638 RepID=UPI0037504DDA
MTRRYFLALVPLSVLFLTGCPKSEDTAPPTTLITKAVPADTGAFKDLDPWILKTTDPSANRGNHGIYLSNGLLGVTIGAKGDAGKDGLAFVAGDYAENEVLRVSKKELWQRGPSLKEGTSAIYEQSLDLRTGVLTTKNDETTLTNFVSATKPTDHGLNALAVSATSQDGTINVSVRGAGLEVSFAEALEAHKTVWAKRWAGRDIVIEGDPEAQQLVHKLMFDLIQSVQPNGSFSVAPEALSGDFYKGHIFWDAEVWMFPALLAQHPDLAKTMLEYRFRHLAQAKAQASKQGCKGIDFPWESASSGNETAPGGFSEGRHVTAGVGWAAWQYWLATGDKAWLESRGWPLLSGIAEYFASKVKKNAKGGYDLGPLTGPDELHMKVTNNAYTNAMAINCLNAATEAAQTLGKPTNPLWATVAKSLTMPKNADGVILRCDGDDGKPGTKQADGELLLWPAQYPGADAKTFDFHKTRPIKNGPAMTDSVHALIAARLGRAAEAEEEFRASYRPFVRGPFLLFSEKRSLDRCVFTTGCGGVLQAILYGFGGLDFAHWDKMSKAPVALPKGWTKLEIQGVSYKGKRYTVTVTPQGRTITPAGRGQGGVG